MRLFVAVELPAPVREAAFGIGEALHRRLEGQERRLLPGGAAWVKPDNMHLTLRFLGEVGAQAALQVEEAIASPFELPVFAVALSGLGLFPPSGRPRVLWLGVAEGQDALSRVHAEVSRRLAALGVPGDDRPYNAHLTLARFREPAHNEVRRLVDTFGGAVAGRAVVEAVALVESRLSPRGPSYTIVARGPLAGRPTAAGTKAPTS